MRNSVQQVSQFQFREMESSRELSRDLLHNSTRRLYDGADGGAWWAHLVKCLLGSGPDPRVLGAPLPSGPLLSGGPASPSPSELPLLCSLGPLSAEYMKSFKKKR